MHSANRKFWEHSRAKYPEWFQGARDILEVGSYIENGSVRDYFSGYANYLGVDWRPGPGVDLVLQAKDLGTLGRKFDVVVSASMLEHDAEWRLSIPSMVKALALDGILLMSWGAALNPPHYHHTAIDGAFHACPAGPVLRLLDRCGIHVREFHYEYRLPYLDHSDLQGLDKGCVVLVGFHKEFADPTVPGDVDDLLPEDAVDDVPWLEDGYRESGKTWEKEHGET